MGSGACARNPSETASLEELFHVEQERQETEAVAGIRVRYDSPLHPRESRRRREHIAMSLLSMMVNSGPRPASTS